MTINDFNSKVDFPGYCAGHRIEGFNFLKLPKFGWFAYNKDKSEIISFTDLLLREAGNDLDELSKSVKHFIKEKRTYHETPITFSDRVFNKIIKSIHEYRFWKLFHKACVEELHNGQLHIKGKYIKPITYFEEMGQELILSTRIGLISEKLLETFPSSQVSKIAKNKIMIPSWCTPQHVASIEVCSIDELHDRTTIFTQGDKGWYGKLELQVVPSFEALATTPGFTWDKKADVWLETPVDLITNLSTAQCLKIWQEAKYAKFLTSPLDLITLQNNLEDLKANLKKLTFEQIRNLETELGISLMPTWRVQNYSEVTLSGLTFIQQGSQYFVERANGQLEEMTNFTITVDKVIKKKNAYLFAGTVNHGETSLAFEWSHEVFMSAHSFMKKIREFFFENRLGIPIATVHYLGYLMEIITRFNRDAIVDEDNKTVTPS